MKCKALSAVVICISCITLLTGCTLFPLWDESSNSVEVEDEVNASEAIEDSADVIKPSEVEADKNIMVCTSPVNVRDAASSNSNVIGELEKGDEVTVLSNDGGWMEIEFKGRSAYVYEKYLEEKQSGSSSTYNYQGRSNDDAEDEDAYDNDAYDDDAYKSNGPSENKSQMYLDE